VIDAAEIDQEDDGEATRWDGSPQREKRSPGKAGPFLTEEARDSLIGHIAMLQARLERYEPGGRRHHHTGKVIDADGSQLRAQVRSLEHRLASVQSELRTAEDAIREHIRQKMVLRRQVEEAHAGRGGRAAGGRGDARPDAAHAPVDRAPADADRRVAPTDAVVGKGDAEHPAGGVAMERPVPAAPATVDAPANAPVNGKARPRPKGGWFAVTLARLGEATTAEVAAADQRDPKAAIQAALHAMALGRVERCGIRGRSPVYRVKA
jgi:hypothetical protein